MVLETTFYDNTLLQYILSIGILILGIIIGRIIYWFFTKVLLKLSKKTKTDLDTKIIKAVKGPAVFFIFYIGFNIAYRLLSLTPQVSQAMEKISFIILVINIVWLIRNILSASIKFYFEKKENGKKSKQAKTLLDRHLASLITLIVNIFLFILAFIYIVDNLGYEIGTLLAGIGIGGLALALAAQDSLKNLFGGITIYMDKPFKVGDRVKLDEQRDGFVREIGLRSTKLETFAGTHIIVPNSKMVDSIVENISREKSRRINMTIGVEYNTSSKKLEQATKIIKEVIEKNKDTESKALISFNEFGDSSLNILVIYWIKNMNNILGARNAINSEIKKRFDKAKISFAFPTRTIYMKKSK